MSQLCSLWFWFQAAFCLVGLSILLVAWRQRNRAQYREDWWADGRGEIFEMSRCVAVYTFVQFFTFLFIAGYTQEIYEIEEDRNHALWVYGLLLIILFAAARSYGNMLSFYWESIFKWNCYSIILVMVDKATDAGIRIYSLSIVTAGLTYEKKYLTTTFVLGGIWLFESVYVLRGFLSARSAWKQEHEQNVPFPGKILWTLPQTLFLMQTSIAYYIPISGFRAWYPRLEACLRHIISLSFTIWYLWSTPLQRDVKWEKIYILSTFIGTHYIAAGLFERHLRSQLRVQDDRIIQLDVQSHNSWLSTIARKQAMVPPNANKLQLSPIFAKANTIREPLILSFSRLSGIEV